MGIYTDSTFKEDLEEAFKKLNETHSILFLRMLEGDITNELPQQILLIMEKIVKLHNLTKNKTKIK